MKSLPQVVWEGPSKCGGAPCSESREVSCTEWRCGELASAAGPCAGLASVGEACGAATALAIAPAPAIAPVLASVAALRNPRRPRADCSVSLLFRRGIGLS